MLSLASIAGLVAMVPGAGAAVGGIASAFGYLIRCTTCLKILGVAALCGWIAWHVHRADLAACDGKIEVRLTDARQQAAAAAVARDGAVKADLEKSYAPGMNALRALNRSLQEKVEHYEKSAPVAGKPPAKLASKPAAGCKLGAAAGVLQQRGPDPAAGAAHGGIADYLRRHPRAD